MKKSGEGEGAVTALGTQTTIPACSTCALLLTLMLVCTAGMHDHHEGPNES